MKVNIDPKNSTKTTEVRTLCPKETFIDDYHPIERILKGTYKSNFSVYQVLPEHGSYTYPPGKISAVSLTNGGIKHFKYDKTVHHVECSISLHGVIE